MRPLTVVLIAICTLAALAQSQVYQSSITTIKVLPPGSLPEGDNGIARKHPGDNGIGNDNGVIFADDFESYTSGNGLTSRWDEAYHQENIRIATEAGNFFKGAKSLEFTAPRMTGEVTNTAIKYLSPGRDVVFFRFYAKYDTTFNVLGSSHNGAMLSASYWDGPGSGPGIKADGYNKFLVSYEAGREEAATANPGELNAYIYHPLQRDVWGDHFFPTGIVSPFTSTPFDFGPTFESRPNVIPQLGRWYCYEFMVKANTPGQKDGRIAFWLDGKIIADFPNLRLRDTNDLKIDRASIDLHVNGSNTVNATKKWYDNVVIGTSYIGPYFQGP
ncbi:MAG: hypothetical protein IT288_00565 [Bdellovibrionales bacterium]|nr:hypothetical protein [Bdellovibrionales bacterium]